MPGTGGFQSSGYRTQSAAADADELRRRFAALMLGRDSSIALFDWDPDREGW